MRPKVPSASPVILWFRQDLRLSDNPALSEAVTRGAPVVPVFIWAPEEEGLRNRCRRLAGCLLLHVGHFRCAWTSSNSSPGPTGQVACALAGSRVRSAAPPV
jgi:hypothetical protein